MRYVTLAVCMYFLVLLHNPVMALLSPRYILWNHFKDKFKLIGIKFDLKQVNSYIDNCKDK